VSLGVGKRIKGRGADQYDLTCRYEKSISPGIQEYVRCFPLAKRTKPRPLTCLQPNSSKALHSTTTSCTTRSLPSPRLRPLFSLPLLPPTEHRSPTPPLTPHRHPSTLPHPYQHQHQHRHQTRNPTFSSQPKTTSAALQISRASSCVSQLGVSGEVWAHRREERRRRRKGRDWRVSRVSVGL
jgi:hypothetical protein